MIYKPGILYRVFLYFYGMRERKDFRILFMGTPEFAVDSLKTLLEAGYHIVGVVTAPDKPAGRGKKMSQPEVKKFALQHNLRVLQPVKLKDENFVREIKNLKPHLGVVVAFRMLPEIVWSLPEQGTINLHASLLPQYRGAAPVNHAIMNGEKETGLTTFFLDKEIDTGNIILQEKIAIGKDEYLDSLHDRMKSAGAQLLLRTVDMIREGKATAIPQDQLTGGIEPVKSAPKIFKEDCLIHWDKDVKTVYNHIRGLSPYSAPFSYLVSPADEKTQVKIYKVIPETANHSLQPGTIVTDGKKELKVAVKNGFIAITELQAAGRKRMSTDAFLRGFPLTNEWRFR